MARSCRSLRRLAAPPSTPDMSTARGLESATVRVTLNQDALVVVVCCVVLWCGVVWCGVVWCGVVWCGGEGEEGGVMYFLSFLDLF